MRSFWTFRLKIFSSWFLRVKFWNITHEGQITMMTFMRSYDIAYIEWYFMTNPNNPSIQIMFLLSNMTLLSTKHSIKMVDLNIERLLLDLSNCIICPYTMLSQKVTEKQIDFSDVIIFLREKNLESGKLHILWRLSGQFCVPQNPHEITFILRIY